MSVSIVKSYDQVGRKEDVSDIITNISPTKTPFQTMVGTEGIHNILHQWQEDSLIAAGSNAQVEGAAAPSAVQNATVMRDNTTQIFSKTASVSGTADVVDTYGRDKETAYQLGLRSAELKRDLEYAMVGVTTSKVTGSDSVARQFANYFPQCDGTAVYTVNSTSGALNTALTSQTAAALREDIITLVSQTLYANGADPSVLINAKGLHLRGGEMPARDAFALRLDSGICSEQRRDVQHRGTEGVADEIAGVVDGLVVSRCAMAIQHEDPLEAVLGDLRPDIRYQRPQRRLPQSVRPRVDGDVADLIDPRRPIVNRRHHDDLPFG